MSSTTAYHHQQYILYAALFAPFLQAYGKEHLKHAGGLNRWGVGNSTTRTHPKTPSEVHSAITKLTCLCGEGRCVHAWPATLVPLVKACPVVSTAAAGTGRGRHTAQGS